MLNNYILLNLKKQYGSIKTIEQQNTALTNYVYKINFTNQSIVLKVFNKLKKNLFNRVNEIKIYNLLNKLNICPTVLNYKINKYFVFNLIQGNKPVNNFANLLAKQLSVMHSTNFSFLQPKPQNIKKIFTKYSNKILQNNNISKIQKHNFNDIIKIFNFAINVKNTLDKNIAFCHNDLNLDNLIIDNNNLWILDFEYASYNDIYFDIACVKLFLTEKDFNVFIQNYEKNNNLVINKYKLDVFLIITTALSCAWALNFNYAEIFNEYYTYVKKYYNSVLNNYENK